MYSFLEFNKILSNFQSIFHTNHSTTSTLENYFEQLKPLTVFTTHYFYYKFLNGSGLSYFSNCQQCVRCHKNFLETCHSRSVARLSSGLYFIPFILTTLLCSSTFLATSMLWIYCHFPEPHFPNIDITLDLLF